jgi:hypothetical protein
MQQADDTMVWASTRTWCRLSSCPFHFTRRPVRSLPSVDPAFFAAAAAAAAAAACWLLRHAALSHKRAIAGEIGTASLTRPVLKRLRRLAD